MKTTMVFSALFGALIFVSQVQSRAAHGDQSADEQQIRKIEQDWISAIVKRNASYLQKHETEDYTFTGPDGKLLSKQEDIENTTTGDTVFDDFKIDSVKGRFYGDTAVVNGLGTIKAHEKDRDLGGKYSWTDVFVKQNGEWKAVAAQLTPLAPEKK